jgi:selenocysteine-specific elongation factor
MWIDRVLHVRGAGTVVTGTLVGGTIARGDALTLVGAGRARRVVARELHVHDKPVARASASTRLALNLPIDLADVARGDLLVAEACAPEPASVVEAVFRGALPRRGASFMLHVGTTHVPATVTSLEPLDEREHLVRLRLADPRPLTGGDRYLLRGSTFDARSGALAGGGRILDAHPHRRSRGPSRRALAEAVRARDAQSIVTLLVAESAPRPAALGTTRLAIEPAQLALAAESALARGELVRAGSGLVHKRALATLADEARALVADHGASAPLDRGMPLATLRQRLADRAGPDVAEAAILAARARRGPDDVDAIAIDGDVAYVASQRGRTAPELADGVARASTLLRRAGVHGASLARVVEETRLAEGRARAVLAVLERSRAAVHAGDLWFDRHVVEDVRARAIEHLERSKQMSVIELKTLCRLPRRQAILLLEHFDASGLTRRVGDARVLAGMR